MVHGRIETTPEQQLIDLRKAYDRYVALADVVKDSGDAALDADERQAREHYARRIAHAYEKSIANTSARMQSMRRDHPVDHSFRRWMVIAVLIVIAILFASSALLGAFLPDIFHVAPPQQAHAAPVSEARTPRPAPVAAPVQTPPAIAPLAAAPVAKPAPESQQVLVVTPTPRPATPPDAKAEAPKAEAPKAETPKAETPKPSATPPVTMPARPAAQANQVPQVSQAPQANQAPPADQPPPTPQASARATPAPQTPVPAATVAPPAATNPASSAPVTPPAATSTPVVRDTNVQVASLPPVTAPSQAARPSTPATPRLEAIAGTHRPPPYPDMAKRAGEQGTTQMQVAISTAGAISECQVIASSGSRRLDAAACSYVQAHWRWQPPTRDGQPAPATTKISVVWNLARAGRN